MMRDPSIWIQRRRAQPSRHRHGGEEQVDTVALSIRIRSIASDQRQAATVMYTHARARAGNQVRASQFCLPFRSATGSVGSGRYVGGRLDWKEGRRRKVLPIESCPVSAASTWLAD